MSKALSSTANFPFPQRVVSLQPSVTVTLRDLGVLDRLVACTKYCVEVCPELAGRSAHIVADSWSSKADEITSCKPDLVIASVPYRLEALGEILKSGVRAVTFAPHSLEDVLADIVTIARIMGVERRGLEVVRDMQSEIERVRGRVAGAERATVFCEEWGKPIISSQSWVAELVEAAGGRFLGKPGAQCTADEVLAQDPAVWIAAWCGAGDRVPMEKLIGSRGWEKMKAVRAGRVYCIRDEFLNTPASTLISGLRALSWAIHPELFPRPEGVLQSHERKATSTLATEERVL